LLLLALNEIKPVATIPITDKTRASISSGRALLKRLTAKVQPVRISAHNSKEPSCPPQIALVLALVPMYGASTANEMWMSYAKPLAMGQFLFVIISFICLGYAFSQDDFSVVYVAQHSNSQMPIQFKLSAIWGGHEGSLLLWALILTGWPPKSLHSPYTAWVDEQLNQNPGAMD
jgi:hypothetical protein